MANQPIVRQHGQIIYPTPPPNRGGLLAQLIMAMLASSQQQQDRQERMFMLQQQPPPPQLPGPPPPARNWSLFELLWLGSAGWRVIGVVLAIALGFGAMYWHQHSSEKTEAKSEAMASSTPSAPVVSSRSRTPISGPSVPAKHGIDANYRTELLAANRFQLRVTEQTYARGRELQAELMALRPKAERKAREDPFSAEAKAWNSISGWIGFYPEVVKGLTDNLESNITLLESDNPISYQQAQTIERTLVRVANDNAGAGEIVRRANSAVRTLRNLEVQP